MVLHTAVKLEDCLQLQQRCHFRLCLGLVAGCPMYVYVEHEADKRRPQGAESGLEVSVLLQLPHWDEDSCEPQRAFTFRVQLRLAGQGDWWTEEGEVGYDCWCAWKRVFDKPWEVVFEGSPYFPGGEMKVEAKFQLLG